MAVKQLPKLSELPEPPDRLVGDQERFDVMTFDSLKAQKKMVNEDLNKTLIPKLNEFAVDVNASVNAAAQSERNAAASATTAGNKATQAAASAATAGTKAGEAAQSAAAAKTSETNAAASKTAAAKSATDAATAQRGAEAARDEAQNLANVGYASKAKAGLAKVDGKTTQADAGGMITAKDVAIGGDAADLASARGQIGTPPIRSFTKTSADDAATLNLNDDKWWVNGEYVLYLRGGSSYGGFSFTPDVNNTPITVKSNYCVRMKAVNLYNNGSAAQEFSITVGSSYLRKFYRTKFRTSDGTIMYYPWKEAILQTSIGNGILFTDGKISVPMATPTTTGLVHGDNVTVVTDNGVAYAKDIAIGGDTADLASERGLFNAKSVGSADCNELTKQGVYNVILEGMLNGPGFGGKLLDLARLKDTIVTQLIFSSGSKANGTQRFALRTRSADGGWNGWAEFFNSRRTGDGIRVTNGIPSVPEYSGATASAPGTSGLVPPAAAAGERSKTLTGSGDWVEMLPITGGTVMGDVGISGLLLVGKRPGDTSGESGEIHLEPGSNGSYPAIIDTTANRIRFFGKPGISPVEVDLESGKFVGDIVGKAIGLGNKLFVDAYVAGTPLWLLGLHSDGKLRPFNKSDIQAGYADSAGYASRAATTTGLTYTFTKNSSLVLPAGGTWFVLKWGDGDGGTASGNWSGGQLVAGGTTVNVNNGAFALRIAGMKNNTGTSGIVFLTIPTSSQKTASRITSIPTPPNSRSFGMKSLPTPRHTPRW